jgi:hypothetical protein
VIKSNARFQGDRNYSYATATPGTYLHVHALRARMSIGFDPTPFSGQSVKIYFAAKGTTSWKYEGTAKTSSTGHFSHTFTAAKDGTWRATYAGNSTYLLVTGSGDYVDVR